VDVVTNRMPNGELLIKRMGAAVAQKRLGFAERRRAADEGRSWRSTLTAYKPEPWVKVAARLGLTPWAGSTVH
jgi:hypothetical protein